MTNGSWTQGDTPGLLLSVLRKAGGDSTLGGVSSQHGNLTLVGTIRESRGSLVAHSEVTPLPGTARRFLPTSDAPAVALVVRTVSGSVCLDLAPVELVDGRWVRSRTGMFGGNYATGGAAWDDLLQSLLGYALPMGTPVKVHDRFEASRG